MVTIKSDVAKTTAQVKKDGTVLTGADKMIAAIVSNDDVSSKKRPCMSNTVFLEDTHIQDRNPPIGVQRHGIGDDMVPPHSTARHVRTVLPVCEGTRPSTYAIKITHNRLPELAEYVLEQMKEETNE